MPNRIPTPGVKSPAVRVSKSAQAPAKPSAKATPTRSAAAGGPPADITKVKGFRMGAGTV